MTHPRKARLLALIGAQLVRALCLTLKFRVSDHAGVLTKPRPEFPLLWAFWHNRLFVMPSVFERYLRGRPGAALTSASKDGEILAAFLRRFGIRPIRGSSSRRGGAALVEMKRAMEEGYIVAVTPDGPRGPRYRVSPGVIKLAQITSGCILPVHVSYSRCWRLKSWDGFMIPQPFATVSITLDAPHEVPRTETDDAFEFERLRFERILRPEPEDGDF